MGLHDLFGGESVLEIDEGNDPGQILAGIAVFIAFAGGILDFYYSIKTNWAREPGWIVGSAIIIAFLLMVYGMSLSIEHDKKMEIKNKKRNEERAREKENELDYKGALKIWKALENKQESRRLRQKIKEEKQVRVDQTVVQGDQVTKTEIKDSVVSKSNIGSGGDDKFSRLEKLTEMKDKGLIDDAEFKQMKKEILGK